MALGEDAGATGQAGRLISGPWKMGSFWLACQGRNWAKGLCLKGFRSGKMGSFCQKGKYEALG